MRARHHARHQRPPGAEGGARRRSSSPAASPTSSRIGTQQRPDLFALEIVQPEPLYRAVVEVAERLAADGSVLIPLDAEAVRETAAAPARARASRPRPWL